MTAQENIDNTKAAYAAFANADIDGASAKLDDSIEWTVPGNSTISGTYRGKDEVIGFWITLAGKGFETKPHTVVGDDDTVVVLTTTTVEGETTEQADVLEFRDGKVVTFRAISDTIVQERIWGSK